MKITYDPSARAAYLYLDDELVLTTRDIDDRVNVDLSADARVIGIEVLDVDMPVIDVLANTASRRQPQEADDG